MPYQINNATLSIGERLWSSAANVAPTAAGTQPTVQFSAFTSCIGICARNAAGTQVIGIHLSAIDQDGTPFAVADVATVVGILTNWGYDPTSTFVIGLIDIWQSDPTLAPAYGALLAALNGPQQYPRDDGVYGAGIDNTGAFVPTP